MQDHGLFQAICRVNRLDGESKEFGYIVDYKALFLSLGKAVKSFTGEAFENYESADVQGLIKDRLTEANKLLAQRLDRLCALCEPVEEPKGLDEYLDYFCMGGNLEKHQRQRVELYRGTAALMRAYAKVCDELDLAGYSKEQIVLIREEVELFANARDAVKLASGDYIDMKMYEAEMRNLIDTYVHASDAESVSTLEDMGMVELLVNRTEEIIRDTERKTGKHAAESISNNLKKEITENDHSTPDSTTAWEHCWSGCWKTTKRNCRIQGFSGEGGGSCKKIKYGENLARNRSIRHDSRPYTTMLLFHADMRNGSRSNSLW